MQGIDWNKIKKEYPKSYELFTLGRYKLYGNSLCKGQTGTVDYLDIEKFFDDNEIIINTEYFFDNRKVWYFSISRENKYLFKSNIKDNIKTRNDIKINAIYKAFEILEEELK